MLDAKDLRIGNLAKNAGGIIIEITPEKISDLSNKLIVLNPIELTEEWLLRFGLIKNNGYPYNFLDGFIKIRNGEYFFKYHNLDIKLSYVHTLQNLHYILAQTELTLKDEK